MLIFKLSSSSFKMHKRNSLMNTDSLMTQLLILYRTFESIIQIQEIKAYIYVISLWNLLFSPTFTFISKTNANSPILL